MHYGRFRYPLSVEANNSGPRYAINRQVSQTNDQSDPECDMAFFYVEPEVAGGLGKHAVVDSSVYPPNVTQLHYRIINWLGDALLESFPALIITREAADALHAMGASGIAYRDVEITVSDSFQEIYPDRQLPEFLWLCVTGAAGKEDFGIADDSRLVVSERVLKQLKASGLNHALIEPYPGST